MVEISIPIKFRPKARLIRLLGENLLKDEVTAILELVKNSHDADATYCNVKFETVEGKQTITIDDDGDGMNVSTITTTWLEPGTSYKIRNPKTKKGRRVLGDKGIGRFAIDKLAKNVDMYTKTLKMKEVIHVKVNWENFDNDKKYLDDITASYSLQKMEFKNKGTIIMLTNLRKFWKEKDLEELRLGLVKLLPPIGIKTDFDVTLEFPQHTELEGLVRNNVIQKAHFRIDAKLKNGVVTAKVKRNLPLDKTSRPVEILIHDFQGKGLINKKNLEKLGPIEVSIGSFLKIRRRGGFKKTVFPQVTITLNDEKILEEWHGVRVYSDNFWVYPYGEDWFNWLDLDQRRVQSPGTKFDSKQIVGFVNISKDNNPNLIQQINREGLMHNFEYDLLRSVVISVIAELEGDAVLSGARRRRKDVENPTVVSATSNIQDNITDLKNILDEVQNIKKQLASGKTKQALDHVTVLAEQVTAVKSTVAKEMIIYDKFAALGKFAGYVIHQINLAIDPLQITTDTLRNSLSKMDFQDKRAKKDIEDTIKELESDLGNVYNQVNKWELFTEQDIAKEKIDLCKYLEELRDEFNSIYKGVKILLNCEKEIEMNLVKTDLWNILSNLIDNSSYWTKDEKEPTIEISGFSDEEYIHIRISDNGLGIPKDIQENIFTPGYSKKPSGKGLGLMIAATAAWRLNGELVYFKKEEEEKGATFELRILSDEVK